ncbi:MAG: ACT domain-containing protein [Spirochaetes bacterium]|nr:ACT domain-containing protein [Spirochaetota bacterium]
MPQQISIFAENKPGKIERISGILGKNNINMRAITIADSGDYGIIKILADRPVDGCKALKDEGIAATLKDIVAVRIDDSPGGLHKASAVLARNDINVEDAYGFTIRGSNEAVFVFQVKDIKKTEKVLEEAGFSLLRENELYFL